MKLISKKYFVALIVALATGSAWGKQAIRIPLAVTQPDGTKVTIVKRDDSGAMPPAKVFIPSTAICLNMTTNWDMFTPCLSPTEA